MALRVWLPLLGNATNQGLSDLVFSDTGTTVDNAGKIGKCLSFNGSKYLQSDKTIGEGVKELSFACWICPGSTTLISGSWYRVLGIGPHTRAHLDIASDNTFRLFVGQTGTTSGLGVYSTTVAQADVWYHICGVLGNNYMAFYVNGNRERLITIDSSTITYTNADYFRVGTINNGNLFQGKLNDVRYYDHALSPQEVKKLAQGLVCHYRLAAPGGENLVTGTGDGWHSYNLTNGTNQCIYLFGNTAYGYLNFPSLGVSVGDKIQVSFDIKFSDDIAYSGAGTRVNNVQGNCNVGGTYTSINYAGNGGTLNSKIQNIIESDSKQGHLTTWFTVTSGMLDGTYTGKTYTNIRFDYHTGTVYVRNVKAEIGDHPTPWLPNPTDTEYSAMGLDDPVEYDCSGFGNNGTKVGSIGWSGDTARYTGSYMFDGTSYIASANGSFSWFDFTCGTISVWMKPTASISTWSGTFGIQADDNSTYKSFGITDYANSFRVTTNNGSYTAITSGKAMAVGDWHHLAATLDGTTLKMYFDGKLVSTQTVNWNSATVHANTKVAVAVDLPGGDEKFIGNISDGRIYSTCLSDSDILALYNLGGSLDSTGTFHTYEYVE